MYLFKSLLCVLGGGEITVYVNLKHNQKVCYYIVCGFCKLYLSAFLHLT